MPRENLSVQRAMDTINSCVLPLIAKPLLTPIEISVSLFHRGAKLAKTTLVGGVPRLFWG